MYNLNVNVNANPGAATAAAGLLSVAADGTTPRTPDIVNSLIAMTNPFDGYVGPHGDRGKTRNDSSSSGEPSPPSIQTTCSQLIKEGLKLTLQTKRRANGSSIEGKKRARKEDGSADDEEDDESSNSKTNCELTPEDEERRRRRRERNKIAATKCRLKKREKTVILVQESETLESQNHTLKSQIQQLETERRELVDMLHMHRSTCLKQQANNTDAQAYQQYADQPVGPLPSYQDNFLTSGNNPAAAASDCAIVSDYGPVKVDSFEAGDFFSQHSCAGPFAAVASTTTTATSMSNASDASCTV